MNKISWWRTSLEKDAIIGLVNAIAGEHISQGPVTEEFEAQVAKTLDIPYAVATTSGSVALLIALMAMGIQRDDEVIVPNRTFIATAHAPLLLGAKVALIDVLPDKELMDISQLRSKITSRTKAIMPVNMNGRAVEMAAVNEIAKEFGLIVIEDACQAFYSRNADGFLGTQSDLGCFSLGMTKLLAVGQGGIVVTKSKEIYERLILVRNHGRISEAQNTFNVVGFNFKFTDLAASIGLAQLSRVPSRIEHLKTLYARYEAALQEFPFITLLTVDVAHGEVPLWVQVLCDGRKNLVAFLNSQGIGTQEFRPDLHLSPHLGNSEYDFPNSKKFGEQGLFLPCGPEQPLENVDRVIDVLRLYQKQQMSTC